MKPKQTLLKLLLFILLAFPSLSWAAHQTGSDQMTLESIHGYWAAQGSAPEDGEVRFSEGSAFPDFSDPDWVGLDYPNYLDWVYATYTQEGATLIDITLGCWMSQDWEESYPSYAEYLAACDENGRRETMREATAVYLDNTTSEYYINHAVGQTFNLIHNGELATEREAAEIAGAAEEGGRGGLHIYVNELSFGGTDALGWTQSGEYQGADFQSAQWVSVLTREGLIMVATAGTGTAASAGSRAALYANQTLLGLDAFRTGQGLGDGLNEMIETGGRSGAGTVLLSALGMRRLRMNTSSAGGTTFNSALRGNTRRSSEFTTWNQFQAGTKGQFASRGEAGTAWSIYKRANGIITGTVRSSAAKSQFLRELGNTGQVPKWMNQWLSKGKVPPGYHVDHIKPLSTGGLDLPANMRLQNIDLHKTHHKYYRPWEK